MLASFPLAMGVGRQRFIDMTVYALAVEQVDEHREMVEVPCPDPSPTGHNVVV